MSSNRLFGCFQPPTLLEKDLFFPKGGRYFWRKTSFNPPTKGSYRNWEKFLGSRGKYLSWVFLVSCHLSSMPPSRLLPQMLGPMGLKLTAQVWEMCSEKSGWVKKNTKQNSQHPPRGVFWWFFKYPKHPKSTPWRV